MGEFNLNLSTRPFPAYRVVNIGLTLFFFIIVGVSVWQLNSFRYYSANAQSIRKAEQDARAEQVSLGTGVDNLNTILDRPVTIAKLTEIDYLNTLILKKNFSWTQVFSNLEGVVPDNVHLTSLAPTITKEKDNSVKVKLEMSVVCRSISDESEFVRRLQASPVFQDVNVEREAKKEAAPSAPVITGIGNARPGNLGTINAATNNSAAGNPGDVEVKMTASYFPERTPGAVPVDNTATPKEVSTKGVQKGVQK